MHFLIVCYFIIGSTIATEIEVAPEIQDAQEHHPVVSRSLAQAELFDLLDENDDGVIDKLEFISGWIHQVEGHCPAKDSTEDEGSYKTYITAFGDWCAGNNYCKQAAAAVFDMFTSST